MQTSLKHSILHLEKEVAALSFELRRNIEEDERILSELRQQGSISDAWRVLLNESTWKSQTTEDGEEKKDDKEDTKECTARERIRHDLLVNEQRIRTLLASLAKDEEQSEPLDGGAILVDSDGFPSVLVERDGDTEDEAQIFTTSYAGAGSSENESIIDSLSI